MKHHGGLERGFRTFECVAQNCFDLMTYYKLITIRIQNSRV